MNPLVIMAIIVGLPLLFACIFRVSSVFLFASVAAGGLLSQYLSDDVELVVVTLLKDKDPTMAVQLALLLLPVVLTFLFLRGTLKSSRFALEVVPLLASLAMLIVLIVPELPVSMQEQIAQAPYGNVIHQSQDVVIGAAVLLNLTLMWLLNKKHKEEHGHGKRHH